MNEILEIWRRWIKLVLGVPQEGFRKCVWGMNRYSYTSLKCIREDLSFARDECRPEKYVLCEDLATLWILFSERLCETLVFLCCTPWTTGSLL